MKICIVIPNFAYLNQAGARIRYGRLRDSIERQAVYFDFREIAELNNTKYYEHDIYIISKCYDARAIALSYALRTAKKFVGVDLFDDYFSQVKDARFAARRYWLNSLSHQCSFAMTSTESMKEVARKYMSNIPIHVMNDPSAAFDLDLLSSRLQKKLDSVINSRHIDIFWFGIGDNPNFEVGIADLIGYSSVLSDFRKMGFRITISILTNRRALTPENLIALNQLPFDFKVSEWTEELEYQMLNNAFLCFVPVNSQNFSVVKSLNRAVSCLTHGVQILSPGFDLYRPLGEFVYRDAHSFIADMNKGTVKLRPHTLKNLIPLLNTFASVEKESTNLLNFFASVIFANQDDFKDLNAPPIRKDIDVILHGIDSSGDTHKFIKHLDGISVRSPFSNMKVNYDLMIYLNKKTRRLNMSISRKTAEKLALPKEYLTWSNYSYNTGTYYEVPPDYFIDMEDSILQKKYSYNVAVKPFPVLIDYSEIILVCIDLVKSLLKNANKNANVIVSENSKLPWHIAHTIEQREEVL